MRLLQSPTAVDNLPPPPHRSAPSSFESPNRGQMQGSSSTEDADDSTKVEDIFGYNSSTAKQARLQSMLSALLNDPILSDAPKKPTIADVDTLISLELGSAMKVSIMKMDNTSFDVAMLNSATVKDLKLAIKKKIEEMQQGQMGHRHISWKHVWSKFCLSHHNDKLIDDHSLLQDYGIRNNSQVHFIPCVVSRLSQRHSRRKKHRFFHGLSKSRI
uniref:U11/U12 small nuclear ribonucleoprotein n=1 Tax=Anthurium amnicola TaxID=1678845 RepID=A0A1D1ZDF3_9ARAE